MGDVTWMCDATLETKVNSMTWKHLLSMISPKFKVQHTSSGLRAKMMFIALALIKYTGPTHKK